MRLTTILHHYPTDFRTHPVQNVRPPLECDALEDCEEREAEVVEVGDAEVGPVPVLLAHLWHLTLLTTWITLTLMS